MTAPSITRGLTLAVDPASSSARVEIPACAGSAPFIATVQPVAHGDDWLVCDPTDEEPTWPSGSGARQAAMAWRPWGRASVSPLTFVDG